MISYFVLTLIYIFYIITLYADVRKIKGKNDNKTRKFQSLAISLGCVSIILYCLELTQGQATIHLVGSNIILFLLAIFSFIVKKIAKN